MADLASPQLRRQLDFNNMTESSFDVSNETLMTVDETGSYLSSDNRGVDSVDYGGDLSTNITHLNDTIYVDPDNAISSLNSTDQSKGSPISLSGVPRAQSSYYWW